MTSTSYTLTSADIKKQIDYLYSMNDIEEMLKIKAITGSQKVGNKYATFYKEQIGKMLEKDAVDLEILKDLKVKVHEDLKIVREDRRQRQGIHHTTDEQTRMNDCMMSMIMDFIASLPEINE